MDQYMYYDTYQAYKSEQSRLCAWMVENSGARIDSLESKPSHKATSVSCSQLMDMAHVISSQSPPIVAPNWIISVLKEVIEKREAISSLFETQSSILKHPATEESLQGHAYYVETLKQVLSILLINKAPKQTRDSSRDSAESSEESDRSNENRFACLNVENLTEQESQAIAEPTETTEPTEPTETTKPNPTLEFEIVATDGSKDDESHFALSSLNSDLVGIRFYLRKVWNAWSQNRCDIISAALTTNLALRHLRQKASEFMTLYSNSRIDDLVSIMDESLKREHKMGKMKGLFASNELERNSVLNAYATIGNIVDRTSNSSKPHVGIDDHKDLSNEDWAEQIYMGKPSYTDEEKRQLLTRAWHPMVAFANMLEGFKVVSQNGPIDEVSRAAAQTFKKGKMEFWMILVANIYIDLHYTLLDHLNDGLEELLSASRGLLPQLNLHIRMSHLMQTQGARPESKETKLQMDYLRIFIQTITKSSPMIWPQDIALPSKEDIVQFHLLKHHPILCGLLKFHILKTFQDIGLTVASDWFAIIPVAHLYKATKNENLFKGTWDDMDRFLGFCDKKSIFKVSEAPAGLHNYWKIFLLSWGVKAHSIKKMREPGWSPKRHWKATTPSIRLKTSFFNVLHEFCNFTNNQKDTMRDVRHFFHNSERYKTSAEPVRDVKLFNFVFNTCESEVYQLDFSLISLSWTCVMFQRQLREKLRQAKLITTDEYDFLSNARSLHNVVSVILSDAEHSKFKGINIAARAIEELGDKKRNGASSMRRLPLPKVTISTSSDEETTQELPLPNVTISTSSDGTSTQELPLPNVTVSTTSEGTTRTQVLFELISITEDGKTTPGKKSSLPMQSEIAAIGEAMGFNMF